jgi:dehydrogenase/reductase SDR family member 4
MMARQGASVVISSRKPEACTRIVQEFEREGLSAIAVPAHAAKEADIKRLVAVTLDRFGAIDVVVSNAAINPSFDLLTDLPEESWARIMDTNLSGPLRLARHALPHVAQRAGTMVFVSSVNAGFGMAKGGAYGISKAAIEQMTRQLAVEWGPRGVRVNAVVPGTTETDMIRALIERPGFIDHIESSTPLGRIAQPQDVAAAIVFLASTPARHITGQCLIVDGGQTIMRGSTDW